MRCSGSSLDGQLQPKERQLPREPAASFGQSGCCHEERFVNVFYARRQIPLLCSFRAALRCLEQREASCAYLEPVCAQRCPPCFCSDLFVTLTPQDRAGTKREEQNMPLQLFPRCQDTTGLSLPVMLSHCSCSAGEEKTASSLINSLQM